MLRFKNVGRVAGHPVQQLKGPKLFISKKHKLLNICMYEILLNEQDYPQIEQTLRNTEEENKNMLYMYFSFLYIKANFVLYILYSFGQCKCRTRNCVKLIHVSSRQQYVPLCVNPNKIIKGTKLSLINAEQKFLLRLGESAQGYAIIFPEKFSQKMLSLGEII